MAVRLSANQLMIDLVHCRSRSRTGAKAHCRREGEQYADCLPSAVAVGPLRLRVSKAAQVMRYQPAVSRLDSACRTLDASMDAGSSGIWEVLRPLRPARLLGGLVLYRRVPTPLVQWPRPGTGLVKGHGRAGHQPSGASRPPFCARSAVDWPHPPRGAGGLRGVCLGAETWPRAGDQDGRGHRRRDHQRRWLNEGPIAVEAAHSHGCRAHQAMPL
jgi:hypothetical protein